MLLAASTVVIVDSLPSLNVVVIVVVTTEGCVGLTIIVV